MKNNLVTHELQDSEKTQKNIFCRHCKEISMIREWKADTIGVHNDNTCSLLETFNNNQDVNLICPRCLKSSQTSQLDVISPMIVKQEILKSMEIIVQKTRTSNKRVLVRINNEIFYPGYPEGGFNFYMSDVHLISMPAHKRPYFSFPLIRDTEEGKLKRVAVIVDEDFDVLLQINNICNGLNAGGGLMGFERSFEKQGIHIKAINKLAGSKYSSYYLGDKNK
ncbi:hypothetical protein IAQ67_14490 [Paenibacillus peoriae]|uniref:Uncharacterized protein n=2 Tax=Paenibacillus peoriae TaxID=59893 RepID=A0A7H0YGG4_9BACL|nr:hypothetical protein IAQ67_14490 [Paenibacillus peoriae]